MITFADLGPVPTVHLFLAVPVPLLASGWTWGQLTSYRGPLAREYAYSARECEALVRTYGTAVPRIVGHRELGPRFRVCAKGPVTGLTLGIREWEWSASRREYKAVGEYMCGWREAVRAYWIKTGEMIERQRFDASAYPVGVVPLAPSPIAGKVPRKRRSA